MEVVKSDEKIEEYIKKSNILIIMYTTFLCTACDSIKHKVIEYGKSRDGVDIIQAKGEYFQHRPCRCTLMENWPYKKGATLA